MPYYMSCSSFSRIGEEKMTLLNRIRTMRISIAMSDWSWVANVWGRYGLPVYTTRRFYDPRNARARALRWRDDLERATIVAASRPLATIEEATSNDEVLLQHPDEEEYYASSYVVYDGKGFRRIGKAEAQTLLERLPYHTPEAETKSS